MTAETYATSINIKHISTSRKARKVLSLAEAIATAKARFRYQTRDGATTDDDVICHTAGQTLTGDKVAIKAKAYTALAERAKKHTDKNGVRLCDTGHISLPNDATTEEQREIARRLVSDMAKDSQALVVASIHHDKKANAHLHWWAVDGLETREAAQARNPEAKRIRQRDQLRLNEGGSREEWRARFAAIVNEVGQANGRRFAEHRSLKDRGIERAPQLHEGVEIQDKDARGDTVSGAAATRAEQNREIIAANLAAEGGSLAAKTRRVPKRWRRVASMFDAWKTRLGFASQEVSQDGAAPPRRFPSLPALGAYKSPPANRPGGVVALGDERGWQR